MLSSLGLSNEKQLPLGICSSQRGSGCYKFLYTINEGTEQEAIRSVWAIDDNIPIFTQDRNYIEKFVI